MVKPIWILKGIPSRQSKAKLWLGASIDHKNILSIFCRRLVNTPTLQLMFCHLQSERNLDTKILLKSHDGVAVWFNSKLVHKTTPFVGSRWSEQIPSGSQRGDESPADQNHTRRWWGLPCRVPAGNLSRQRIWCNWPFKCRKLYLIVPLFYRSFYELSDTWRHWLL